MVAIARALEPNPDRYVHLRRLTVGRRNLPVPSPKRGSWGPLGAKSSRQRVDVLLPYGFAVHLRDVAPFADKFVASYRQVLRQFLDRRFVAVDEIMDLLRVRGPDALHEVEACILELKRALAGGWQISRMTGGGFALAQAACPAPSHRRPKFDTYREIDEHTNIRGEKE
jgi:hypothetical protein